MLQIFLYLLISDRRPKPVFCGTVCYVLLCEQTTLKSIRYSTNHFEFKMLTNHILHMLFVYMIPEGHSIAFYDMEAFLRQSFAPI